MQFLRTLKERWEAPNKMDDQSIRGSLPMLKFLDDVSSTRTQRSQVKVVLSNLSPNYKPSLAVDKWKKYHAIFTAYSPWEL